MLPNINLDDKHFKELLSDALEELHKYNSSWTDQNLHDPGITFIELFAWLSEMQRYYLNRVSSKSKENIFRLLGIKKEQEKVAKSKVILSNLKEDLFLPRAMKFLAGELVFQSQNHQWILANEIKYVHVEVDKKIIDKTRENLFQEIYFYPFGEEVKKDNKLYIGFDNLFPINKTIELTFINNITEEKKDEFCFDKEIFSVDILWEVSSSNGDWEKVDLVSDTTMGLTQTGKLSFKSNVVMEEKNIYENSDKAFWLRGVVKEDYNEIPVQQENIRLNMVEVEHKKDLVSFCEFNLTKDYDSFHLNDYLQLFGDSYIQVSSGDGYWKDISKTSSSELYEIDILNKVLSYSTNSKEDKVLRLLSYSKGFLENTYIGPSLGVSNQVFELYIKDIIYKSIVLQVAEKINGNQLWCEWQEVDNFDFSKATDKHFKVNYQLGQIEFGDNINASIPAIGNDNIRIISLITGGGVAGNIREHEIKKFLCSEESFKEVYSTNKYSEIEITNLAPAKGGRNTENIKELSKKLLKDLNRPFVAVTARDYEIILSEIPMIEIERTHVISNYDPKNKKKTDGHVTVVVMPKADTKLPKPSDNFKAVIKEHLEPSRLITTKLHVIGPSYVKIDLSVRLYITKDALVTKIDIRNAISDVLSPKGNEKKELWGFGEKVKKSVIYRVLASIHGVERVEALHLHSVHKDAKAKSNGDIYIEEYCVPYLGENTIDIVVT